MAITPTGDSLLAVDFGSTTTRVALFDVVDGEYRFVAAGGAPTTAEPPYLNVVEGLRHAVENLRAVTGRVLMDDTDKVIMPARGDGGGVDAFVATASAGQPLKTVIMGLLPDVSVESALRAAQSTYLRVSEVFGLGDRRREEQQVDAILKTQPDLVIIAGGTEGGAVEAVMRLAETVGLACELLDERHRPRVLFAGNAALRDDVSKTLKPYNVEVHPALNLRPSLDVEQIDSARHELAALYQAQRAATIGGMGEVALWGGGITPTSTAFGRLIRYLSKSYDSSKGALGVDLGSAHTTVAAAFNGRLSLYTQPDLGMGYNAHNVLDDAPIEHLARWLPVDMPDRAVRDYVLNKTLHPNTIPQDVNELHLEHALARQVLREALRKARPAWPASARSARADLLPWFEPIVAAGGVLAGAPRPAHAALVLLDALQPTGITTLLLDANGIAAALGAASPVNSLVTIQVTDSGALLNLGPVVAPVGLARAGQTVLRIKMSYAGGDTVNSDIAFGSIQVLPLSAAQTATINLQPLRGFDVGRGPGRPAVLRDVEGGAVGLIVDARGRPLILSKRPDKRREANQKWLWEMGG
ncbi:MAG: glutamate mutase L [Chloroflexi bacterium]|nr:glutamate mutase L [Chloroflexota bacterium]